MTVDPRVIGARCPSGLQFKVIDGNRIEVKCRSRVCTRGDSVVLHRFSFDGELLETLKFKDAAEAKEPVIIPERKYRR